MTTIDAVHQFHSGTGEGDAVTNQMLELQRHLRHLGYRSEIFTQHLDAGLTGRIRPVTSYAGSSSELLLVHHSHGHDLLDDIVALANPIVAVYHNVTPERYFTNEQVRRLHPDGPRAAQRARPALALRSGSLQLQPTRDAGGRLPAGRGAPRTDRLLVVRSGQPSEGRAVPGLALCRAHSWQQVSAPACPGLRRLPAELRAGGEAGPRR